MTQNLLMIMFDGLPAYRLKVYGGPVETPNIRKLLDISTSYSNIVTTAPSTAMSLTSMFTALYPHEFGRRSYANDDSGLPPETISLFQDLEQKGYNTFVLWHKEMETANPAKYKINVWQGANTKFIHYKKSGSDIKFIRKIEQALKKIKKGKIFQFEEIFEVSAKLQPPWAMFVRIGREVSREFRGSSNGTTNFREDDEIYETDHVIGQLLDNYPSNTKVVISSDHGHMHGEQGTMGYAFNLLEGTLKVPLVIHDPENPTRHVVDELTSLVNYKNIIFDNPLRQSEYLYCDTAYADQWHRKTMVRKANWKYIYHRDGWPCKEQFFDLTTDPHEMINLAQETYTDPYRDSRPKGDTVSDKYSPSGMQWDGKPFREVLQRTDWDNILATLEELRAECKRVWATQDVYE
ncbi:sulfatase-like hydrolase/transferase [Candidatus Pacearchaeota archaeon]|nr:sulfatase-like hydrolase/transferase [Candidatus Pacearchaeota archaeon]